MEADVPLAPRHAWFGVVMEAGAPSGVGVGMAWRPFSWLQLVAGPSHNGAAIGARAGIVLAPFRTFVRPTLSAHAGYFPEGDAQGLARFITGDDALDVPVLTRLQYDYTSAQLGVELGAKEGTSFFLRGGMSRTVARLGGFEAQARKLTGRSSLSASTPTVTLITPCFALGLSVAL